MSRVVLLDRDGVINADRETGVLAVDELVMEEGAVAGIVALSSYNVRLAVCTNQACVGRGELQLQELHRIHDRINECVTAAGGQTLPWYVCTHRAEDGCRCRKPKPGLLEQARRDLGFDPIDTVFVGDGSRDVDAAVAAGCRPFLVLTGKGETAAMERPGVMTAANLGVFAKRYIGGDV